MRCAVVFFSNKNRMKLCDIARGLVRGIESQGHQVDIIDGYREQEKKLTIYQYIAIGTEAMDFFGKIPDIISKYLAGAGIVGGKPGFAFVIKTFTGSQGALMRLMKAMEHEGMFLRFSDILEGPSHAEAIGKRLHIQDEKLY
jgi:hypothetical protein